jgi:hypothetical protein
VFRITPINATLPEDLYPKALQKYHWRLVQLSFRNAPIVASFKVFVACCSGGACEDTVDFNPFLSPQVLTQETFQKLYSF